MSAGEPSNVVHLLPRAQGEEKRVQALAFFCASAKLPALAHVKQRGRDADAVYTFEFADGRVVRVGTIKVLWSQAELGKVLSVAIGKPLPAFEPASWYTLRTKLLTYGVEVEETPGESFSDIVRDWLGKYCEKASSERNAAMMSKRPYVENDEIRVHAVSFAREIRRQFSASIKEKELLGALADLGFTRRTIMYDRGSKRASASYYCAPLGVLDPGDAT